MTSKFQSIAENFRLFSDEDIISFVLAIFVVCCDICKESAVVRCGLVFLAANNRSVDRFAFIGGFLTMIFIDSDTSTYGHT